jgi:hypothetical protein
LVRHKYKRLMVTITRKNLKNLKVYSFWGNIWLKRISTSGPKPSP